MQVERTMSNWHGGKGSKRRKSNEKAYSDNWDKIFGKKNNLIVDALNTLSKKKDDYVDERCDAGRAKENTIRK